MGVGPRIVSSSSYDKKNTAFIPAGNPNPYNFKVIEAEQHQEYIILKVNYPDCKNYEGNKVLIYKATLKDILNQKSLDPHFSDNKEKVSPIARFTPDDKGWKMAKQFVDWITRPEYYR